MDRERFLRTRRMILTRVLLAPAVILLLGCAILIYYFAADLRERVMEKLVGAVDAHRELLVSFLDERAADLNFVAESYSSDELRNPQNLERILKNLRRSSRGFFDLGFFDGNGNHLAYIGPYKLTGKNYGAADWFNRARSRKVFISDVFEGQRKLPHFVMVVKKTEGGRDWFLRATVDTDYFEELVARIREGQTGDAYVVNAGGVLQTGRRGGQPLMLPDPDFVLYGGHADEPKSFSALSSTGRRTLFASARLSDTGWILVATQESSEALGPLFKALWSAGAMVAGGGAVVAALAYLLASSLASRLTSAEVEKRKLGNQLIAAGKLAEVGEMSSGLAHEINNPLQIISAEETLIEDLVREEDKKGTLDRDARDMIRDSLREIKVQVERCRRITQGLLRFSRRYEPTLRSVRPDEIIDEVVKVVGIAAAKAGAGIKVETDSRVGSIVTDPGLLQQVVVNLVNNAVYAVRDRDGGEVSISTRLEDEGLALTVTDNGSGITSEDLEKIFLPFYTTKPVGQGTGLGLSTVYGVVERLGGTIEVASEPGAGAVFTVRLPLHQPGTAPA